MRKVTLTFDNGPTPSVTHRVLDVLDRHGISATFFVVGRKLADPAAREAAERAHAAGHWIGNHSFTHDTPLGRMADPAASVAEISQAQDALGALAHPRRFFRPFGGGGALGPHLLSRAAFEHLCAGRYTGVTWNAIPRDWAGDRGWTDRAFAQCMAQDRALLVLHDLATGAMQYLDEFLSRLAGGGAEFVQDFPPDCVIIRDGLPAPGAERFAAD